MEAALEGGLYRGAPRGSQVFKRYARLIDALLRVNDAERACVTMTLGAVRVTTVETAEVSVHFGAEVRTAGCEEKQGDRRGAEEQHGA